LPNRIINLKLFWRQIILFVILLILPRFLSRFYVYASALIFTYALLAMSLNLVLGYGGMLQLHQCVFYGVGAYTVALILTKTSLPMWIGFVAGPIVAAMLGLLIGWFCVRLRGIYFGMLTIALGQLVWAIVFRWYDFTGGDDGIHGIPLPSIISSVRGSYYFTLIVTTICLIVLYLIVKSPFGSMLQAIRDNPERSEAVGINIGRHRLAAFVIASFFGGIAGVLFVTLESSVFPTLLFWEMSAEVLIMCILGGMFTFAGPVLGATLMVLLRIFVGTYTEYWTLILGLILLLLVIFLPEGITGYLQEKFKPHAKAIAQEAQR
jgi:branched-chain amino acid transport system permease protein